MTHCSVRHSGQPAWPPAATGSDARDNPLWVLRHRYAEAEFSTEEYQERKAALEHSWTTI